MRGGNVEVGAGAGNIAGICEGCGEEGAATESAGSEQFKLLPEVKKK